MWLRKEKNLKRETEFLQIESRKNAIRSNSAKANKYDKIVNVTYELIEIKQLII